MCADRQITTDEAIKFIQNVDILKNKEQQQPPAFGEASTPIDMTEDSQGKLINLLCVDIWRKDPEGSSTTPIKEAVKSDEVVSKKGEAIGPADSGSKAACAISGQRDKDKDISGTDEEEEEVEDFEPMLSFERPPPGQ